MPAIAICASNYAGAAPESYFKRWSQAGKKTNVLIAYTLILHNQKNGEVDLFDQFVATICSKSDGGCFFSWSLNAAMTNSWLLHKKIHCKNISLLAFMRKVAITMLASSRRKRLLSLQYAHR